MINEFMADKLIISFKEYTQIVEKLAIQIHNQLQTDSFSRYYEGCSTYN